MTYDEDTLELVLSSGKRLFSCSDTLGICFTDAATGIAAGYDNHVWDQGELTDEEREEIGGAMIAAWTRWMRRS